MSIELPKFKDDQGRFLTLSMFIETAGNPDYATYTLAEEDKTKNGKTYKSLKQLYLETEDPSEWLFVERYLYSWPHWCRILDNALLRSHVTNWRMELSIKLQSRGIKQMLQRAENDKTSVAAKWVAEGGWRKRKAGAPSNEEKQAELHRMNKLNDEFGEDILRVQNVMHS